jgi:uncharacterized protein YegJ (DUF2314 family)
MKKAISILLIVLIIIVALAGCNGTSDKDGVVNVSADDEKMNAAINEARESLDVFWDLFNQPVDGESDFTLKVRIKDKLNNVEHLWVDDIRKENDKIYGTVQNEPVRVKTVKYGQVIEISEEDITDWTYIKNSKIHGGFTIRVLLDYIPKEEAEQLRLQLSDKPL